MRRRDFLRESGALIVTWSAAGIAGKLLTGSAAAQTLGRPENSATGDNGTVAGEPRLVYKVKPVYPPEAKKQHLEGVVHIDTRLAKDGSVAEARATDGHPMLAEAALAAVRQWRYEPVLGPDAKPVEVKLTITVNFRLAN